MGTLTRWERVKVYYGYLVIRLHGWRPIRTAPKDGTTILVLETPNGDEAWNIMAARWMTFYGRELEQPAENPHWWGAGWRAGYSDWEGGPWGRAMDVAIGPNWWKPMPRLPGSLANRQWANWIDEDGKIMDS